MEIELKYFAIARDKTSLTSESVRLKPEATIGDAWRAACERHPRLAVLRPHIRFAHNLEFAHVDTVLRDGDTVAVIPPVCGGSGRVWITDKLLDRDIVEAAVRRPDAGAIVTFSGVVRNATGDRAVAHLEYEIYEEMARNAFQALVEDTERRWTGVRVALAHRYGRVEIEEESVIISVSSPHRKEAFEACQYLIDTLKETVPIWKKEVGPDGAEWIGMGS
jgi:MoaE-MoaD fusion protein